MVEALTTGKPMKEKNTVVRYYKDSKIVELYNTVIYVKKGSKEYFSCGEFETITTKSRLNALGCGIQQKKGVWHSEKPLISQKAIINAIYN